jgi:hypothetical protein
MQSSCDVSKGYCCTSEDGCGSDCPDKGCECPHHVSITHAFALVSNDLMITLFSFSTREKENSFYFLLKKPNMVYLASFIPPNIA